MPSRPYKDSLRAAIATLALLFAPSATLAQVSGAVGVSEIIVEFRSPVLWAGLTPGPYDVGYRRIGDDGAVVHAWYPASIGDTSLRFRDYLSDDGRQLASFLAQVGLDSSTIDSLFASPLRASKSPPPLDGPFPLVLMAQGNGHDAVDQVVLCEHLASHGFVVAATPSPMIHTPLEREDQVGEMAEKQALELSAAVDALSAVLNVDLRRIGIVGHSFGARAALLLAMRDERIGALVSLDGGIGTATAIEDFRRAPSFRSDAPLPPILHFFEELDEFMTPDFQLLKSLRAAELVLTSTEGMHHVHFTTYGFAAAVFPEIAAITRASPATTAAVIEVVERTTSFLHRHRP